MDYKKIYQDLVDTRLSMKIDRLNQKKSGVYFEGHHIIPKSKGGTGTSTRAKNNPNIVLLTAREHFLAHWLLWRIHRDRSSALAFHKMMSSNDNQKRNISSRGYEEARLAFSETNKGNQYGKGQKKVISVEQRMKTSLTMKGRYSGEKNYFYGKKHTQESKNKISEKAKMRTMESIPSYKGVRVLYKDGNLLAEFKSNQEISDYLKIPVSGIKNVLGGSQKTTRGYEIKYKSNITMA